MLDLLGDMLQFEECVCVGGGGVGWEWQGEEAQERREASQA